MKLTVVVLLLLVACSSIQIEPLLPGPKKMGPVEQTSVERVCDKLRELECEAGDPTPEGNTCERNINNAAAQNINLVGDVDCIEVATNCAEAEACDG